jgi:glycosyltransferase involved in cell wall biosynthesis
MRDIVPIKLYEYMAMAKPVISTRLPGVVREFGEDNGIIYVHEPQEVIATAFELARSGKAKLEGAKARRFVENMGWDSVVDKFEATLNNIVVRSPRSD